MTERIAAVSLTTILLLLFVLTAARGALYSTRIAAFRALADLFESVILAIVLVFLLLRPFVVQSYFIPSGSMHPTLWEGDHILVNKWVYRFHAPVRGDIVVFRAPHAAAPDEKEFIKRVIGLPGDVIAVEPGMVTVGGLPMTCDGVRASLGERYSVAQLTEGEGLPPLRLTRDAIWLDQERITPEEFARRLGRPGVPVRIFPGRVLCNGHMLLECYIAEDPQYSMQPRLVPSSCLFVMGDNRNNSADSHLWGMLPAERVIGRADLVFWPISHLRRLEPQ